MGLAGFACPPGLPWATPTGSDCGCLPLAGFLNKGGVAGCPDGPGWPPFATPVGVGVPGGCGRGFELIWGWGSLLFGSARWLLAGIGTGEWLIKGCGFGNGVEPIGVPWPICGSELFPAVFTGNCGRQ